MRPWITKAAAMIGLPPTRSATMGEESAADAAHREETEDHRGRHQREALLDRQGHHIEQHNPMARAAQAVDQRLPAGGAACGGQRPGAAAARSPDSAPPAGRPRSLHRA